MQSITKQFAIDIGCDINALKNDIFVYGEPTNDMFYYHRSPAICILYKDNLFFRGNDQQLVDEFKHRFDGANNQWFFDVANIKKLMQFLDESGYEFTQWGTCMVPFKIEDSQDDQFKLFFDEEIKEFKGDNNFNECFVFEEQDPDRIGVAYMIDGKIVGMAGCNQNGKFAFEIGVNVLPEYRGQGIATKLIKKITYEIIKYSDGQGIPIAGTQFSHTKSINAVLRAGYEMGWTEIAIEKKSTV